MHAYYGKNDKTTEQVVLHPFSSFSLSLYCAAPLTKPKAPMCLQSALSENELTAGERP